jgi:hypothetical protein
MHVWVKNSIPDDVAASSGTLRALSDSITQELSLLEALRRVVTTSRTGVWDLLVGKAYPRKLQASNYRRIIADCLVLKTSQECQVV